MAPADSTSSPRDHAADANPGLARKKQRLSEDPGASPTDSIIIEADEPEDIGSNMDNAIEIEDGLSINDIPYSDDFYINSNTQPPLEQLRDMLNQIQQNYYWTVPTFVRLARALEDHVSRSLNESSEWQQRYLEDESEFFNTLAKLCVMTLNTGDLFEPKERYDAKVLGEAIGSFLFGAGTLCYRIIPFLPDVMKSDLSRRDSAHASTRQHAIGALLYVQLAAQIVLSEAPTFEHIAACDRRMSLELLNVKDLDEISPERMVTSLTAIIRTLGGAMRNIKDSWMILHKTFDLFDLHVTNQSSSGGYPKTDVESVIEVVNACILPIIREKHPRALPEKFHDRILTWGATNLTQHVELLEWSSAASTFRLFISSASDALIPEEIDDRAVDDALSQACGGNKRCLAKLFADSWAMQTAKSLICSDIMDVRTVGLTALMNRLIAIHRTCSGTTEAFEHPEIQHAVRFLRKNELIPYILGPESRAGLLVHGIDMIAFLAATQTYTDAETDIIWKACSTNVEADFVKAAFAVLDRVMQFLDSERLLYLAKKYSTTTLSSFGVDALEYLPKLIRSIEHKVAIEGADKLAIAFVSIEILKSCNSSDPCPARERLKGVALTEIYRFAGQHFSADDRAQICRSCVPEISNHTKHATAAVEVLHVLSQGVVDAHEAESLLILLPIDAAVGELCTFVATQRSNPNMHTEIFGIIVRLDLICSLTATSIGLPSTETQECLFTHVFGEEAISYEARDAAWDKLCSITTSPGSSLDLLLQTYMQDYVPPLHANLATPRLVSFVMMHLKSLHITAEVGSDNMSAILTLPLWKAIIRFATTSPIDAVVREGIGAILDMLFEYPLQGDSQQAAALKSQTEFVIEHIEYLQNLHDRYVAGRDPDDRRQFMLAMTILDHVFERSKAYSPPESDLNLPGPLRLGQLNGTSNEVVFKAQVYGAITEPSVLVVQATEAVVVSELLVELQAVTYTDENRVIAGGVEISQSPDKTLKEAGIKHEGVVHVRPKYSAGVDLDRVLPKPGPVEQAILSRHSLLEVFLDGPDETAFQTRAFLEKVRLPPSARLRVVASTKTTDELLPPGRSSRTSFSLFVLRKHLSDLARLGVADRDFMIRAVRLLTAFILDKQRPFEPLLMLDILSTLCQILRERPLGAESLDCFDDGAQFAIRLTEILLQAKALPVGPYFVPQRTPLRSELAATAYRTLIITYQSSNAVWNAFVNDANAATLHGQLLLDDEIDFSAHMSRTLENLLTEESVSRDLLNFYWAALYPCLPDALLKSYLSERYFCIANKILSSFGVADCEEHWIIALAEDLCSKLWSYQHTESPLLMVGDRAMLGLLRLFSRAVALLKKKTKGCSLLQGLPAQLFSRLLFPQAQDSQYRPLVHEEARNIVYDLIRSTFKLQNDYNEMIQLALATVHRSVREEGAVFPGMSGWIRPPSNASGLHNLGMTCYMNSLLQQLFGNLQFRKFILDQPIVDLQKQAALLKVQQLFTHMQESVNIRAETGYLAATLGIQVGVQDDVHTFYTALLSRLEESMPDKDSKQALISFFTGKSITQIKGDCGHVSSREEPFTELSITVKNKASLHDSLNEFVQGEPLEGANKYMCMSCDSDNGGRLVNAMRRTCLDDVPNSLTVCLKRFAFENLLEGENKVNDRFEFPAEIDMSHYKRSYLDGSDMQPEADLFELVGVIVHQGSLSYGHYWSYVRVPAPQNLYRCPWIYLEDEKSVPCADGIQQVQENCFGGLHWADGTERPESAYVLFYQRKSYVAEADTLNLVERYLQRDQQILPRVPIQGPLAEEVNKDNAWRLNIASLFNNHFGRFLQFLLDQYPAKLELGRHSPCLLDDGDEVRTELDCVDEGLDSQLGELIANYVLRIFLADPKADDKLIAMLSSVQKVTHCRPAIATHVLRHLAADGFGFGTIIRCGSAKVRAGVLTFFEECLMEVKDNQPDEYSEIATRVVKSHAAVLHAQGDSNPRAWREYLHFAAKFAKLGPEETSFVLDQKYLQWALEVLYLHCAPVDIKRKHDVLFKQVKTGIDRTAVFEFLYDLFSGHMDLSYVPVSPLDESARTETELGWQLQPDEVERLFYETSKTQHGRLLFDVAIQHCSEKANDWRDYAPGKLIGFLVGGTVDERISGMVLKLMRATYDAEDRKLDPLLFITLHMLLNLQDIEGGQHKPKELLEVLAKNLILWESRERRSLWFLKEAYVLAPEAVIHSVPAWAHRWLQLANYQTRQDTCETLKNTVFRSETVQDDSLEALRIRCTRNFVTRCQKILDPLVDRKEIRSGYESLIGALKAACDYLSVVREDIDHRQEQGEKVDLAVLVEFDEVRSRIPGLIRYLDGLRDWEPATALPTRSINVRRSVEVDDSDDFSTDADGEDNLSEISGL